MEIKRFQNRSRSISFFLISFSLVFLILSAGALYKNKADRNLSVTLNRFQSDFIQKDTRAELKSGRGNFDRHQCFYRFWHLSDRFNNLLSL